MIGICRSTIDLNSDPNRKFKSWNVVDSAKIEGASRSRFGCGSSGRSRGMEMPILSPTRNPETVRSAINSPIE